MKRETYTTENRKFTYIDQGDFHIRMVDRCKNKNSVTPRYEVDIYHKTGKRSQYGDPVVPLVGYGFHDFSMRAALRDAVESYRDKLIDTGE